MISAIANKVLPTRRPHSATCMYILLFFYSMFLALMPSFPLIPSCLCHRSVLPSTPLMPSFPFIPFIPFLPTAPLEPSLPSVAVLPAFSGSAPQLGKRHNGANRFHRCISTGSPCPLFRTSGSDVGLAALLHTRQARCKAPKSGAKC